MWDWQGAQQWLLPRSLFFEVALVVLHWRAAWTTWTSTSCALKTHRKTRDSCRADRKAQREEPGHGVLMGYTPTQQWLKKGLQTAKLKPEPFPILGPGQQDGPVKRDRRCTKTRQKAVHLIKTVWWDIKAYQIVAIISKIIEFHINLFKIVPAPMIWFAGGIVGVDLLR